MRSFPRSGVIIGAEHFAEAFIELEFVLFEVVRFFDFLAVVRMIVTTIIRRNRNVLFVIVFSSKPNHSSWSLGG